MNAVIMLASFFLLFGVLSTSGSADQDVDAAANMQSVIIDATGHNHSIVVKFYRPSSVEWKDREDEWKYSPDYDVYYHWQWSSLIAIKTVPAGEVVIYRGKKVIHAMNHNVFGGVVAVVYDDRNNKYDGDYWVGYWH